jgi:hypothetical protein
MKMSKDAKELRAVLERRGWRFLDQRAGSGHWIFEWPRTGEKLFLSSTSSDRRAREIKLSEARRVEAGRPR